MRSVLIVAIVIAVGQPWEAAAFAHDDDPVTVAGTGAAGSTGDGGPARQARLNNPTGVAVAPDGTVYVSDTGNHRVRAVGPDGIIRTVAGTGRTGRADVVLPDGAPATSTDLAVPTDLAVGPDGTLFIADPGLHRVLARHGDGRLTVVAGDGRAASDGDGGPASDAALGQPHGLAVGPDGTVYVGDLGDHRVRAVGSDGIIRTVAGNGGERLTAAGGAALSMPVPAPACLSVDPRGTLWIADGLVVHTLRGGALRTLTRPEADRSRWAVSAAGHWPPPEEPINNVSAVAVGPDGVYLLAGHALLRLDTDGTLDRLVALDAASVGTPGQIAVGPSGAVFLADIEGNRVLSVRPDPARPATRDGELPWWPLVVAGLVIILGSVLAVRVIRRRQIG